MVTKIDWAKMLEEDMYIRLCECNTRKSDLPKLSKVVAMYNPSATANECLELILEWVGDWNSQFEMIGNLTENEIKSITESVQRFMNEM